MKKGEQSKNISVVSDQVGGPTSAHSLANAYVHYYRKALTMLRNGYTTIRGHQT